MSDLKVAVAEGLSSEICGSTPIVDGEEWSVMETERSGSDVFVSLEDEDGKTYSAVLRIISVMED